MYVIDMLKKWIQIHRIIQTVDRSSELNWKKTKIYKKFHIKIENMSSIPISYFEYHIISLNEEVLEPIKLGFKENDKFWWIIFFTVRLFDFDFGLLNLFCPSSHAPPQSYNPYPPSSQSSTPTHPTTSDPTPPDSSQS